MAPPATTSAAYLLRTLGRVQLHQIDSVNVLARAHYLLALSPLGACHRADLDRLLGDLNDSAACSNIGCTRRLCPRLQYTRCRTGEWRRRSAADCSETVDSASNFTTR